MNVDIRLAQILALGGLLAAGVWARDFSLQPLQVALTFAAGLCAQFAASRAVGLPRGNYLSALISCLGISLLLRADNFWIHPLAATLAISSKFTLRTRGKHIFNPGNLGITAALILLPGAWVSPGQWGHDLAWVGWVAALGTLITRRVGRADITLSFLATYLGLVAAVRVGWLGYEWAVWRHQLDNAGLILFAFFMISDPRTSPDHRAARILHGILVAAAAYLWQYALYFNHGYLWALLMLSPAVPLWDRALSARRFEWRKHKTLSPFHRGGPIHEIPVCG